MSTANVSNQYSAFDSEGISSEGISDFDTSLHPANDVIEYFREYARQKPEVAALWCLGVGFILGWKLKPW